MIGFIRRHWVGLCLFVEAFGVMTIDNWFVSSVFMWALVLWYLDERGSRRTAERKVEILDSAIRALAVEVATQNNIRRGRPIDAASVPLYNHERTTS